MEVMLVGAGIKIEEEGRKRRGERGEGRGEEGRKNGGEGGILNEMR